MDLLRLPVWNDMKTITLSEMNGIKLMNRIDTKYLIPEQLLPELLEQIKNEYRVQIVEDLPVNRYDTLYYDTKDAEMYTLHHNKKLARQKVRTRTYVESSISFLEIKLKNNKGRTDKRRISIPLNAFSHFQSDPNAVSFINKYSTFPDTELLPLLENNFERVTLVNNEKTERLTIDGHIQFRNMQTGITRDVPELMIFELKQDGHCPSPIRDLLSRYKILPKSFSKYCLGTVITNPRVKSNNFKTKLRFINKLTNNQYDTMY